MLEEENKCLFLLIPLNYVWHWLDCPVSWEPINDTTIVLMSALPIPLLLLPAWLSFPLSTRESLVVLNSDQAAFLMEKLYLLGF